MEPINLLSLPNEVLETVGTYLNGPQLANLSFVCRRLHRVLNQNIIWQQLINRDNIILAKQVKDFSTSFQNEMKTVGEPELDTGQLGLTCGAKFDYMIGRRVIANWRHGHYSEGLIQHMSADVRVGFSSDYLVVLESGRMRAWSIVGRWVRLITTRPVNISLENPSQTVYQILVSGSIAVLCFTFCEEVVGSDFQHLQAYDLSNGCQLVWEKSGLLGTQYHVIRLLGSHLYILDLLMEKVEVYDINENQPVPKIILVQPQNSVRIPHGDISAGDTYLAVPGKKVPENSPVISCWNIITGERRLLSPDRPVCPFRWFQKSAVRDNLIYGLLNRFRLICWDGRDGQTMFSLDLTNTSPGDNEETFSWLEVGPEIVLTVHQEKFSVSVLSLHGALLGKICPVLPDWCHDQESVSMVEEVCLNGVMVIIRILNYSMQNNSISCIILSTDITSIIQSLHKNNQGPNEEVVLHAHVLAQHLEPLDSPHCQLLVTNTKVFDVQPLCIKFYDFLTT